MANLGDIGEIEDSFRLDEAEAAGGKKEGSAILQQVGREDGPGYGEAMTKFVLIGAAGYIAPRHMAAIKAVGGDLVAVLDPHDSVGVLDSYFPSCCYFREFERFDRFCCKQAGLDYVVVCSPNYLHDAHIRFGLRVAPHVICEKPVVLNERNLDQLLCEQSVFLNNSRVNCILQLRLHPLVKAIYPRGQNEVVINYSTPRGAWYDYSWKADEAKSGGLVTNIGSHLFDLCGLLVR